MPCNFNLVFLYWTKHNKNVFWLYHAQTWTARGLLDAWAKIREGLERSNRVSQAPNVEAPWQFMHSLENYIFINILITLEYIVN